MAGADCRGQFWTIRAVGVVVFLAKARREDQAKAGALLQFRNILSVRSARSDELVRTVRDFCMHALPLRQKHSPHGIGLGTTPEWWLAH